jgi:hypothetical protein
VIISVSVLELFFVKNSHKKIVQLFIFVKHLNFRKRQKFFGVSKIKKDGLKMLGGYKLMNKFLRVLGLGLMVMTFAFVGFAQERTQEVVYAEFTTNFESTETAKMQIALNAAKEFIAKFNTPDYEAQVTYLKDTAIPYLEEQIKKKGEMAKAKTESDAWFALLGNIEKANKAKNCA